MNIQNKIQKLFYPDWPSSGTPDEWVAWHKKAKERPVAYWIAKTAPLWISVKRMQIDDIRYWFKYRLQKEHKYHIIDTKLKPGYHEIDERMLYGMFSLLVDYVEKDKATMYFTTLEKDDVNKTLSKSEAGLKYLDWETELLDDDDKPSQQSILAYKIKYLYIWWTVRRPKRQDPMDTKEFKEIYAASPKLDPMEMLSTQYFNKNQKLKSLRNLAEKTEKQYQEEDDKMLNMLVHLRHDMW